MIPDRGLLGLGVSICLSQVVAQAALDTPESVCRVRERWVREMGGELTLDRTHCRGARFVVRIPAADIDGDHLASRPVEP